MTDSLTPNMEQAMREANPSLHQSLQIRRVVLVAETLVAATLAIGVAAIIFAVVAGAGDIVQYVAAPPSEEGPDRWVYRFVDGRTCWFIAGNLRRGREKPIEELRWPS